MKTTIEIADPLFERARRLAAKQGTTLRGLMEQGLLRVLQQEEAQLEPFRLRNASFRGDKGLRPEMAAAGWDAIRAASYEQEGAPD
jgi:hypothetical protein